jgi:GTP-binding protein EngB required for normal cell division
MVESSNKIVICVLGQTGQGKSSLLNALLNKNDLVFKLGENNLSCTTEINFTDINFEEIILDDVPGF